jgi:hypothetical protein
MMEHRFSTGRDLLPSIKTPAGAILPGSPALKEQQKSARLPLPDVPTPWEQIFSDSPSSWEEIKVKAIPAKHSYVKFYI